MSNNNECIPILTVKIPKFTCPLIFDEICGKIEKNRRIFNMKKKDLSKKITASGVLNSLALKMVCQSANSACAWVYHQPEFPDAANRFKKH